MIIVKRMDFKNPTLNGKTITLERKDDTYDIAGVNVISNICCRRMTYMISYIQDIETIDHKTTTLAEQTHANDTNLM